MNSDWQTNGDNSDVTSSIMFNPFLESVILDVK